MKCIYIDPPYNTGSDGFVYFDNFNYTKDALQEKLSVSEDEADRILELTKRGSASHSAWLMFMYSRLLLAKDLLTDNGIIFISIDDSEQANLKLLCDDIFGEENSLSQIIWDLGTGTTAGHFTRSHEYIFSYAKNMEVLKNFEAIFDDNIVHGALKKISRVNPASEIEFPAGFPFEGYNATFEGELGGSEKEYIISDKMEFKDGKLVKPTLIKAGWAMKKQVLDWIAGKETFDTKGQRIVRFYFNKKGILFYEKERGTYNPKTVLTDIASTKNGSTEIKNYFGSNVFSYPKPSSLVKHLMLLITQKDDLVLDFFSGSATTADAVMQLNLEDEGNRKFISVQLPQVLDPNIDSQKAAYEFLKDSNLPNTLDYIGIERIKRAASKIKQEHPDTTLDLGFKHFTLNEPNQNTLDRLETFDKRSFIADISILDDFGKPTILTTWLNSDGYGLTVKAEVIDLAGYTAYYCQKHLYLIDSGFTLDSMKALLGKYNTDGHFKPENMVLFGYSFPEWSINEMLEKNLRILNDSEQNLKINFIVRY